MKTKIQEKIIKKIAAQKNHYESIENLINSKDVIKVINEGPTEELYKYLKKYDIVDPNRLTLIAKIPTADILAPEFFAKIEENLEDTNMSFIPLYKRSGKDDDVVVGYIYINKFYYIDEKGIKIDIIEGLLTITPNSTIDNSDFDRFSPEQISEMQEHIKSAYSEIDYYENFAEIVQDMQDERLRDFIQNSNLL